MQAFELSAVESELSEEEEEDELDDDDDEEEEEEEGDSSKLDCFLVFFFLNFLALTAFRVVLLSELSSPEVAFLSSSVDVKSSVFEARSVLESLGSLE